MDALQLSRRLATVASYVPDGARLADIGSDHAYLPANLLLNKRISFAIAGEVAQGPLDNVQHEINRHRLGDVLVPRLADGLAAVQPEDLIDTVTIAGMGGRLIAQILTAGHADAQRYQRLILQPNIDIDVVRTWLMDNGYQLTDETVVADDGHFYEILVAVPGHVTYDKQALQFGPYNLVNRPEAWLTKWQREYDRIGVIMAKLADANKQDTPAYQEYQAMQRDIGEVLGE
ncbi:tRNA (adenine(22)-N(1))-methyltransferase [Weissella cibaria]|uniref:tRNA (adenine(22)-N(1))-methyltransferase n=1 Tax=Weissella cibaria TaxID=137591 RepID=UPI00189CF6CD|nr:class I SAM-dependent methyltransferase [Weissella cibaria]